MADTVDEVCPRCRGFVWHRREPCNCQPVPQEPAYSGDFLVAVGKRLAATRQSCHLSLDGLCERSGLSRTYLWQLESGKSNPSATTLCALATSLGVTVDYLLLRSDQ